MKRSMAVAVMAAFIAAAIALELTPDNVKVRNLLVLNHSPNVDLQVGTND